LFAVHAVGSYSIELTYQLSWM